MPNAGKTLAVGPTPHNAASSTVTGTSDDGAPHFVRLHISGASEQKRNNTSRCTLCRVEAGDGKENDREGRCSVLLSCSLMLQPVAGRPICNLLHRR